MMQGMGSPLQEALQKVLENTALNVCAVLKMVSQSIMLQMLPGMLSGVCSRLWRECCAFCNLSRSTFGRRQCMLQATRYCVLFTF